MKQIISLVITLGILFTCGSNVYATANVGEEIAHKISVNEKYTDLTPEHRFYDSISYLYEEGYLKQYPDENFNPDENMNYAEAIILLEKVFYNRNYYNDDMFWKDPKFYLPTGGYEWTTCNAVSKEAYLNTLTLEDACQMLLEINEEEIMLFPELYDSEVKRNSNGIDLAVATVKLKGYNQFDLTSEYITRGNYCDMVVWAITNISTVLEPVESEVLLPIKMDDSTSELAELTYDAITTSLLYLPENTIKAFNDSNHKLIIMSASKLKSLTRVDSAVGVYTPNNKKISIPVIDDVKEISETMETFIHEFGHFIGFRSIFNPHSTCAKFMRDSNMKEEIKEFSIILDCTEDGYFSTSKYEFFAEAFVAYIYNGTLLEEKCPNIYDLVDKTVSLVR